MPLLGITSETAVDFQAQPGGRDPDRPIQNPFSRAFDGTARQAREPIVREWEYDVGWLPGSSAAVVNSWWSTGAPLLFWEDPVTYPNSAWPVRIANPSKPFDRWQFPYWQIYREGTLTLEARSAY